MPFTGSVRPNHCAGGSLTDTSSLLLYLQIYPHSVDGPPNDPRCPDRLPVIDAATPGPIFLNQWYHRGRPPI